MRNKNNPRFPIDYKIEYGYKNVSRKRYINTFTPEEAVGQFWDHDNVSAGAIIKKISVWNKFRAGGTWDDITDSLDLK
jgi:hypothetical protein